MIDKITLPEENYNVPDYDKKQSEKINEIVDKNKSSTSGIWKILEMDGLMILSVSATLSVPVNGVVEYIFPAGIRLINVTATATPTWNSTSDVKATLQVVAENKVSFRFSKASDNSAITTAQGCNLFITGFRK